MVKCAYCGNEVEPVREGFSWGIFIFLLFLTLITLGFGTLLILLYVLYYFTKKKDRCPICGHNVYTAPKNAPTPTPTSSISFCPYCGSPVSPDSVFCPKCGKKIRWAYGTQKDN